MEQRTFNIIMCCKGNGRKDTIRESIADYMSRECGCDYTEYNESILTRIIKEALYDYLKTCYNPSNVIRNFFDNRYTQDFDRIAYALCDERVKNNIGWVNGFNENMWLQSKEDLGVN